MAKLKTQKTTASALDPQDQFIISDVTYQIGGPKKDSIGLVVDLLEIPETLEFEGQEMIRKPSFHVTLLPAGNLAERYGINMPNLFQTWLKEFQDYIRQRPLRFLRWKNEFRSAEQNDLKTIVAMCEVENLHELFIVLNQKYGVNMETPPTHVTLYTLNGGPGIFLIVQSDLQALTQPIINPEILQVLWQS